MNEIIAPSDLRILACQIMIPRMATVDERNAHLKNSVEKVNRQLAAHHADLVVLPELSSIDYSRHAFANLSELSEPLHGTSFSLWRAVARRHATHIAYGFARRAEDGFCISLAVIAPSGDLLGYYDKIHLAHYGASTEKEYFSHGGHIFVFEVKGFRIAPIICYDIRIPELSRALAVNHGADMILHTGAYYRDSSFYSWHQFAISRALENQVFLLSLNRAGACYGNSIFCPPWVDDECEPVVFSQHGEQFQRLAVARTEIEAAREQYSFLHDRLESYALPVINAPDSALQSVR